MKVLHIISSPRGDQSRTLKISSEFLVALKAKHANAEITELDLFAVGLPDITIDEATTKYAVLMGKGDNGHSKAWQKMAELAKDFLLYDVYVISCPMWNFSIPYKLKHYIDLIVQPGLLFQFTEKGIEGLAKNKKMYCISTRGSDYNPDGPMNQFDLEEPYLRTIFGFVGITDIEYIHAQPMDISPELAEASLSGAISKVKSLAAL